LLGGVSRTTIYRTLDPDDVATGRKAAGDG
jgi:hypothetical protein